MAEYYLDIETNGSDLENDKILTIQYQELGAVSGRRQSDLTILKSWESSEENILKEFHSVFKPNMPFDFIPIGMSLHSDLFKLHYRWKKIGLDVPLKSLFYDHPFLDIKPILVILNDGKFKGASLGKFTGKKNTGADVPKWYAEKDFILIENYIREEAEEFIRFYQNLKEKIPKSVLTK